MPRLWEHVATANALWNEDGYLRKPGLFRLRRPDCAANFAENEAARVYLNGAMTREEAAQWLQDYGMMREDKSFQRTRFERLLSSPMLPEDLN